MTEQSTVYSQLMALRDRQRALQAESPFVLRGAQLPWESNPQGTMSWYLHPAMQQSCHKALIFSVQKIPHRWPQRQATLPGRGRSFWPRWSNRRSAMSS